MKRHHFFELIGSFFVLVSAGVQLMILQPIDDYLLDRSLSQLRVNIEQISKVVLPSKEADRELSSSKLDEEGVAIIRKCISEVIPAPHAAFLNSLVTTESDEDTFEVGMKYAIEQKIQSQLEEAITCSYGAMLGNSLAEVITQVGQGVGDAIVDEMAFELSQPLSRFFFYVNALFFFLGSALLLISRRIAMRSE